jgi:aminoglycoside phosphotransferase
MLSALAGRLPVPPVLDRKDACLTLGFLPGVHGQELIDSGMAQPVLDACGRMLRRIHSAGLSTVPGLTPRSSSPVLVHGDYGPQNVLLDPAAGDITAVVDWESPRGRRRSSGTGRGRPPRQPDRGTRTR